MRKIVLLIFFPLLYASNTSIVYNYRVAQITQEAVRGTEHPYTIIALPFDIYQKKYLGIKQNFGGIMSSLVYNFGSCFVRGDFAFAHVHEKRNCISTLRARRRTIFSLLLVNHL